MGEASGVVFSMGHGKKEGRKEGRKEG